MAEITIPHNYKPRDYQLEYLKSDKRFSVMVWSRRSGKSKTVFNKQIVKALKRKGIYYYFLPTYKQAKSVIWETFVREHLPPEVVANKNNTELTIELTNGSILHYAGCEDIDKHRGINPIDVVFDEFAEMKPEIWTAIIQPVLRENKGTMTAIFTPKGKNHAYDLFQQAKNNESGNWFCSKKDVYETNSIDEEEIEGAKMEMPQALFQQEFECKFLDEASAVFRRVEQNVIHSDVLPESGKRYQLGVDLAKYNDYTVVTVTDLHTLHCYIVDRFNKIDWSLQIEKIEAIARRYNDAEIWIDSTGVGDPIFEQLDQRNLRVKEFKFTETSREQLLSHLSILLEQDKIRLVYNEVLIDELHLFRYELKGRKVRAGVPESLHDDTVMSLALSVWGLDKRLPDPRYMQDETVSLTIQDFS